MNAKLLNRIVEIAKSMCPYHKDDVLKATHIAFLVKKGKIVKIGWNKAKTNPHSLKHPYVNKNGQKINVYTHAELDVVLKMGKDDLSDHEIVVIRIDGKGELNNSRPCPGCYHLLRQTNIRRIYFSTSQKTINCE